MTLRDTDNEYRIIVTNIQTADGAEDVIREMAYGSYSERNGKRYIIYRTEEDGDTTASIIIIDGGSLTIRRRGTVSSSMVYKAGSKYSFPYETPYGVIDMELETHRLISDLDSDGGVIQLVYTLSVQGERYFNDMKITVNKR